MTIVINTIEDLRKMLDALPDNASIDIDRDTFASGNFQIAHIRNNGVELDVHYGGRPAQAQVEAEIVRMDAAFTKLNAIEAPYRKHFGAIPPVTDR